LGCRLPLSGDAIDVMWYWTLEDRPACDAATLTTEVSAGEFSTTRPEYAELEKTKSLSGTAEEDRTMTDSRSDDDRS